MRKSLLENYRDLLLALLVSCIVFLYFYLIQIHGIKTDFNPHMKFAKRLFEGEMLPNPLFYALIGFLTPDKSDYKLFFNALNVVLSLSIGVKFLITKSILNLKTKGELGALFALVMVFAHNLLFLTKNNYLGNFSSNIWHNSTTIFVMPFALLLFWYSYKSLKKPKFANKDYLILSGLILLNLLAKPSFVFAFVAAYPLYSLVVKGFKKEWVLSLIPVVFALICILGQKLLIYDSKMTSLSQGGGVMIDPFRIWDLFSGGKKMLTIYASFLFPISVILIYNKKAFNSTFWKYALALLLGAFFIFILFREDGSRAKHGNMMWQVFICTYIFFIANIKVIVQDLLESKKITPKSIIPLAILALHFLSGPYYLYIFLKTGSYI